MSKGKLLLIDDEQELVMTLTERLNIRGYEAYGVTSFSEALPFIRQNPDIVILDIGLQDTDGLEVLKRIKEINPLIQVIMLSGYGDNERINKSLQHGACGYLIKPVDIDELISKIESAKQIKEK